MRPRSHTSVMTAAEESLEEILAILSEPELVAAIREAEVEVAAGRATRLSKQEALAEIDW